MSAPFTPQTPDPSLGGMIKLAIMAVGGQGGGVLTGWIEDLARAEGWHAQATSVAGVAQRTGATVYYIEMAPPSPRAPVFSLMPAAGDVDIMMTAELMEAGRAVLRGFVTPDRTVLITSTHRALAVSEKMVPGNGIANGDEVLAAAEIAARQVLAADFDQLARDQGSVITASMFGALAGSGLLPFPRSAFEAAIRQGGKGVEPSLRAFDAGFAAVLAGAPPAKAPDEGPAAAAAIHGPARLRKSWQDLTARLDSLPAPAREMARLGLEKVVDFQGLAYGQAYLDRLEPLARADQGEGTLAREAAKYIANAMAYDDLIRVADRKTRSPRQARIKGEMAASPGKLLFVTEYFHPGAEEITGLMPARMGARWQADPSRMARLQRWFSKGRRIRSDRVTGFALLWLLGGLRWWRPRSLRHAQEMAHLQAWLDRVAAELPRNPDLAVEILRCRRLIKGYSDTQTRGLGKYDRVLAGIELVAKRPDAADWARRLREAALQDEEGQALDGAIATIRSFV